MDLSGPIASLIIHKCGYKVTMFVGGFIAALGLFLCAFANDIYMVCISFGLLTGTNTLWHNEKIKSRRLIFLEKSAYRPPNYHKTARTFPLI